LLQRCTAFVDGLACLDKCVANKKGSWEFSGFAIPRLLYRAQLDFKKMLLCSMNLLKCTSKTKNCLHAFVDDVHTS